MKKILILQVMAFFALFLCVDSSLLAQLSTSIPISKQVNLTTEVPTVVLPGVSESMKDSLIANSDPYGSFQFAYKFPVNYAMTDVNVSVVENWKVWRMAFESPLAGSLSLDLENFNLSKDASVYVYSHTQEEWVGPFTDYYNSTDGIFLLPAISGDKIIIEVNYPANDQETSLTIKGVNDDYVGVFNDGIDPKLLPCHIDVNCDQTALIKRIKRSVVKMVYNGNEMCTATLLNQSTNGSSGRIVLTAAHCYRSYLQGKNSFSNINGSKISFYFNNENAICRPNVTTPGSVNAINYMFVTGATPLSFRLTDNFDYFFMSIDSRIPSSYDAFYAGWNAGNGFVTTPSFMISHPLGEVKMLAINTTNTPLSTRAVNFGDITFDPGNLWDWIPTIGETSQSGSSGAALLANDETVRGVLTGGVDIEQTCDFGENNFFSMMRDIFTDASPQIGIPAASILGSGGNGSGTNPFYWDHASIEDPTTAVDNNLKVWPSLNSITSIGADVFFRATDGFIHRYAWNGTNWAHNRLAGATSPPSNQQAFGSISATSSGSIYFRGANGVMKRYFPNSSGGYSFQTIGVPFSNESVSNSSVSIASNGNNQIFFRGTDDFIHLYTGATHNHHILGGNDYEKCAGDVVGSSFNSQVFYRGTDGQIHTYYWTGSNWGHGWIGGQVSSAAGSIAVGPGNIIYFRGTDDFMRKMVWNGSSWVQSAVGTTNPIERIGGDIEINTGGQVFYQGRDGKMHTFVNDVHDYIESSEQAPSQHNVSGSISVNNAGQLFYRGATGKLSTYWWKDDNLNLTGGSNTSLTDVVIEERSYFNSSNDSMKGIQFGNVFPNPVEDELFLPFSLAAAALVEWQITNLLGQTLQSGSTTYTEGAQRLSIRTNGLNIGTYVLVVSLSKKQVHRAMFLK